MGILLLAVIDKTRKRMAEEGGSKKCGIGLIIVLVSWIISMLGQIGRHTGHQWVIFVTILIVAPLSLIGATIAVMGLIEKRNNPEITSGGRAAGWAIFLAMFFWCALIVGVVVGLRSRSGSNLAIGSGET